MASDLINILLIEDDPTLRKSIVKGLAGQGFGIQIAGDLATAKTQIETAGCDLVLLDLGLPDGNGFDFLKLLRMSHAATPVLILTARDSLADKIKGLDLGADDYLVKPFAFQELCARIRAQLRRSGAQQQGAEIHVHDLFIDLVARVVKRGDLTLECTPREFDVLVYMAKSPGQAITRQMLTSEVWKVKSRMTSMDNVIDVLMSRLREKIDGQHPDKLIHTVRGLGYMIKAPA